MSLYNFSVIQALSCCLLLLASGSCIYLSVKRTTDNFFNVKPEIIAASVGVLGINLRSFFNLLSPFFLHSLYPIDPLEISNEEKEKAELRVVPVHEKLCRIISMSGLILAICESYDNRKVGLCIVTTLTLAETHNMMQPSYPSTQNNRYFHFLWMLAGFLFGWMKGNSYCTLAYLPYGISFLAMPPEENRAWSAMRLINNYAMMVHTFLMFEAIREARSIEPL